MEWKEAVSRLESFISKLNGAVFYSKQIIEESAPGLLSLMYPFVGLKCLVNLATPLLTVESVARPRLQIKLPVT